MFFDKKSKKKNYKNFIKFAPGETRTHTTSRHKLDGDNHFPTGAMELNFI